MGGDEAFVKELVAAYLAESPQHVDALTAAVAANDVGAVVRPAHTLKSSSAAVGAMGLSAVSKQVEQAAREGQIDHAGVDRIRTLWPETVAALSAAGLTE